MSYTKTTTLHNNPVCFLSSNTYFCSFCFVQFCRRFFTEYTFLLFAYSECSLYDFFYWIRVSLCPLLMNNLLQNSTFHVCDNSLQYRRNNWISVCIFKPMTVEIASGAINEKSWKNVVLHTYVRDGLTKFTETRSVTN